MEFSAWLASFATVSIGILVLATLGQRLGCVGPALTGFALHSSVGIFLLATAGLQADAKTYHQIALESAMASDGSFTPSRTIAFGKSSFTVLLSVLYQAIGANPIPALIGIGVIAGLLPIIVKATSRNLGFSARASTLAAWLVVLMPQFLLWIPALRREAFSFALLALMMLAASLIYRGSTSGGIGLMVIATGLMAVTRSQLVLVGLSGTLAALILRKETRSRGSSAAPFIWGLAVLVPGLIAIYASASRLQLNSLLGESLDRQIESNSSTIQNLAVSGATAAFNTSPLGIAINLPRSLFGPFPWEWRNSTWAIVALEGVLILFTFVIVLSAALKKGPERRPALLLLAMAAPLIVGGAVTLANYGIALRLRDHVLLILVPLLAQFLARHNPGPQPEVEGSDVSTDRSPAKLGGASPS